MTARHAPRKQTVPGPDVEAEKWQPPGVRKDTPPKPVPVRVRRDRRQRDLLLPNYDEQAGAKA
jgi:hypothetical protein